MLVIAPESYGDCFERARHLPELTKRGIDWQLAIRPELVSVFQRVFPNNIITAEAPVGPSIDLLDGVAAFLNSKSRPDVIRFLPSADRVQKYLGLPRPAIGIYVQSASRLGDSWRSLKEKQTELIIAAVRNVNWVSLQPPNLKEYQKPIPCLRPVLVDWEDTLGLIENLDAVVSVDSAVAHLSLAMGKPTVVLLGTAPTSQTAHTKFEEMYPKSKLKCFHPTYGGLDAAHAYEKFIKWAGTEAWPQFYRSLCESH